MCLSFQKVRVISHMFIAVTRTCTHAFYDYTLVSYVSFFRCFNACIKLCILIMIIPFLSQQAYCVLRGGRHLFLTVLTAVDLAVLVVRHRAVQHVALHVDLVRLAVSEWFVRTQVTGELPIVPMDHLVFLEITKLWPKTNSCN